MTADKKQVISLLKIHNDLDEETIDSMWERAVFIFDANVLLDLYRLPQSAKHELLGVLNNPEIKDRIWIGFQGLLEFLNNRHDTIGDQKNKFEMVRSKLQEAITGYNGVFNTLTAELAKLKLRKKHSLIDPERFISPENIKSGINFVHEFLDELSELEKKQSDVHHKDDTKKHVLDLFDGKVGYGFSGEEVKKIYEEGEERYRNEIPPGYMDKKKNNFYTVLDVEYKCKFGDLLFWHEILRKAQSEKLEYVILVTGDLKEDWWLEKRGKKLGPRKELLNEIYTKAPDLKAFHMYETSNFLRRVGEKFTFNVSESTIFETENLTTDRNNSEQVEWVAIQEILDMASSNIKGLSVSKDHSFLQLPIVNVSSFNLFSAIYEIADNVNKHASEKTLHVSSRLYRKGIAVRFANPCAENNPVTMASFTGAAEIRYERGSGLDMIRKQLTDEDIKVQVSCEPNVFWVEMYIPMSRFYSE